MHLQTQHERYVHPLNSCTVLTITKDFVKRLKNYILRWTSRPNPNVTSYDHFTDEDRKHVGIMSDALYQHKTLQLRYTAYDMLEDQDKLYQRRYPDIMVLSDDQEHPYMYARVLNLFHVNATNSGPNTLLPAGNDGVILQMVWVRWFKLNGHPEPSGFHLLRYPSVSFYESHDPDAFGFIHPDEIIRAVHLIPSFKSGQTAQYLDGPSKARPETEDKDWEHFNVNMYVEQASTPNPAYSHPLDRLVDRDMFMRFCGGGVGHRYMRQVEPWLDKTGWGSQWPSLSNRDPDPSPIHQGMDGSNDQAGGDMEGIDEDEDEDEEMDEDEDDDDGEGNDPEQLDDDDDLDEEEDGGGNAARRSDPESEEDEEAVEFLSL